MEGATRTRAMSKRQKQDSQDTNELLWTQEVDGKERWKRAISQTQLSRNSRGGGPSSEGDRPRSTTEGLIQSSDAHTPQEEDGVAIV